jgi:hypothetical protein
LKGWYVMSNVVQRATAHRRVQSAVHPHRNGC